MILVYSIAVQWQHLSNHCWRSPWQSLLANYGKLFGCKLNLFFSGIVAVVFGGNAPVGPLLPNLTNDMQQLTGSSCSSKVEVVQTVFHGSTREGGGNGITLLWQQGGSNLLGALLNANHQCSVVALQQPFLGWKLSNSASLQHLLLHIEQHGARSGPKLSAARGNSNRNG